MDFRFLQYRLILGVGFSSKGMAFCASEAIEGKRHENGYTEANFDILEFWEDESDFNIKNLRMAINKYLTKKRYHLAVSDKDSRDILGTSYNYLSEKDSQITSKNAEVLIASMCNEDKVLISEKEGILFDQVIEKEFGKPESEETLASKALKHSLGVLIYLAQTQKISHQSFVGAPLKLIDFGGGSSFAKDQIRRLNERFDRYGF